jgi:hypothetical protein
MSPNLAVSHYMATGRRYLYKIVDNDIGDHDLSYRFPKAVTALPTEPCGYMVDDVAYVIGCLIHLGLFPGLTLDLEPLYWCPFESALSCWTDVLVSC